jgi:hypothetical protein
MIHGGPQKVFFFGCVLPVQAMRDPKGCGIS